MVTAGALANRRETERRRMRRLTLVERKLDAVLNQLGVQVLEPHLQEVEAPLRLGRTIQAIKAYRATTGAGLREAKEKWIWHGLRDHARRGPPACHS